MATPNYKLRGDHVATVSHMRSERIRNDLQYASVADLEQERDFRLENDNRIDAQISALEIPDPATIYTKTEVDALLEAFQPTDVQTDQIKNADSSTVVAATTAGATFTDDSVPILTISKQDTTISRIKTELIGLQLSADETRFSNKDGSNIYATFNGTANQITAPLSCTTAPQLDAHLTTKGYVDAGILAAKNSVSQIVDANTDASTSNNYRVRVDNNQIEFRTDNPAEELFKRQFRSTASDAVVETISRPTRFLESSTTNPTTRIFLRHENTSSAFANAAALRISTGTDADVPYSQLTSYQNVSNGSLATDIIMYPAGVASSAITNKTQFSSRMGYTSAAVLVNQNDHSILERSECDARYRSILSTLNEIPIPTSDLLLNQKKIVNLAPATGTSDAVRLDQLQQSRLGFSTVNKNTAALTLNQKVTGFSAAVESNAVNTCYWDGSGQNFLVTTSQQTPINIRFTCRVSFAITATGNSATLVMRDFTNNSNYNDTVMVLAEQNQTGTFERSFSVWKQFDTNRLIGLYCTQVNGSPAFSNLNVTFTAESQSISTALNRLESPDQQIALQMDNGGISLTGSGQQWYLNGATLYGAAQTTTDSDFDALTTKSYVDLLVGSLANLSKVYVCRLNLGDATSGVPSVIASTGFFVDSVVKVSPAGSSNEQGYRIVFAASGLPSFISSGLYSVNCQLVTPNGGIQTWVNDWHQPIPYDMTGAACSIYLEQIVSVAQVIHLDVQFFSIA